MTIVCFVNFIEKPVGLEGGGGDKWEAVNSHLKCSSTDERNAPTDINKETGTS